MDEVLKNLLATPDLPSLGPSSRGSVWDSGKVRAEVERAAGELKLKPAQRDLVESAVLLWHDHLDESHTLSQDITSSCGSFLHGIMHRREPDYGNAKYWFTRTGQHATFPEIAARVSDLLDASGDTDLRETLVPNGRWDSFAMVDAVAAAERGRRPAEQKALLQKVQQVELEVLLESFCG